MSTHHLNGKVYFVNLKIAPEHIRFRITEDEFSMLMEHGTLSNATSFGSLCLYYGIRTHNAATNREGHILELNAHSGEGDTRYMLTVFTDGIARLKSGNAAKDGIQEHLAFDNGDLLSIGLEIDLHSKKGSDKS